MTRRALVGVGVGVGVGVLLALSAGCFDDPSSPRLACDDLRDAFVAKSESLGCGLRSADYTCTVLGAGPTCNRADIDACLGAIEGSADCPRLGGAGNCVLHCD